MSKSIPEELMDLKKRIEKEDKELKRREEARKLEEERKKNEEPEFSLDDIELTTGEDHLRNSETLDEKLKPQNMYKKPSELQPTPKNKTKSLTLVFLLVAGIGFMGGIGYRVFERYSRAPAVSTASDHKSPSVERKKTVSLPHYSNLPTQGDYRLTDRDVRFMLERYGLNGGINGWDRVKRWKDYDRKSRTGRNLIHLDGVFVDLATRLMWGYEPIEIPTTDVFVTNKLEKKVSDLNARQYLGHKDWRVPHILELASLIIIPRKKQKKELYVHKSISHLHNKLLLSKNIAFFPPPGQWQLIPYRAEVGDLLEGTLLDKSNKTYLLPVRTVPNIRAFLYNHGYQVKVR